MVRVWLLSLSTEYKYILMKQKKKETKKRQIDKNGRVYVVFSLSVVLPFFAIVSFKNLDCTLFTKNY